MQFPERRRRRSFALYLGLAALFLCVYVSQSDAIITRDDVDPSGMLGAEGGEDRVERLHLKEERATGSLSPCEKARRSEGPGTALQISTGDLDRYLDRLASSGFSGAVLVMDDGEVFLKRGLGAAERSTGRANTTETLFYLASVSKQFTAAAVAKLVDEGRLAFDDTLCELLDSVPPDKAGITLHQLLTHSSGLVEYVGGVRDRLTRDEALQTIFTAPLRFAPGDQYGYSNAAYVLLAMIVENASGMTFPRYMHREIFGPAGMKSTVLLGEQVPPDLTTAHGYSPGGDQGDFSSWTGPAWAHWGSGGVFSSLEDMARWEDALRRAKIVSETARDWLFTPWVRTREQHYGYGWRISRTDYGGALVYHFGSEDVGMSTAYLRFTSSDTTIIVLSNGELAAGTAVAIARKVLEPGYDELPDAGE